MPNDLFLKILSNHRTSKHAVAAALQIKTVTPIKNTVPKSYGNPSIADLNPSAVASYNIENMDEQIHQDARKIILYN